MASTTVTVITVVDELPPIRFRLRMGYAIVGMILGYVVALALGIAYHNSSTAAFAALSGVLATICFVIHLKANANSVAAFPERLRFFSAVGAVFGALGLGSMCAFIGVAASQHQTLHAERNGYYLTSIWCFMTAKWGWLLFYYTRQYFRVFCSVSGADTKPLINDEQRSYYK